MKWEFIQPVFGDMVRVKTGGIWHYGVFVSDDEVIQFGLPPCARAGVRDCDVEVLSTNIDRFLCGGFLEVAVLDKKERAMRKKPSETVETARKRLGEKGYSILYNNCEHFANECVFGQKKCSQTDDLRAFFRNMPIFDVYWAIIPPNAEVGRVHEPLRNAEIDRTTNEKVKLHKYYVWRLLEYAMNRTFGLKPEAVCFTKEGTGKWTCDKFEFSLSHSGSVVAVALSRKPIGVDVEEIKPPLRSGLEQKILNESELDEYNALPDSDKIDYLIRAWSVKESAFKAQNSGVFTPKQYTQSDKTVSREICDGQSRYYLSATGESASKLRLREHKFD